VPRALETEEIPALVATFKEAAQRAKNAGFDMVEVHSANGYLLNE
jgi:N-ethylmaleimide reductase